VAGVGFVFATPGQRLEQQFLKKALEDLHGEEMFRAQSFVYRGEADLDVGGTRASAYTWGIGKKLHLRVAFVPACERRATAVLTMMWSDGDDGWEPLEKWIGTIALDPNSPACVYSRTATD
jgi:hypothetical protein